jgi:hypothetical protein
MTAMEHFIKFIEQNYPGFKSDFPNAIDMFLANERDQIEQAFEDGYQSQLSAKEYFNKMYEEGLEYES